MLTAQRQRRLRIDSRLLRTCLEFKIPSVASEPIKSSVWVSAAVMLLRSQNDRSCTGSVRCRVRGQVRVALELRADFVAVYLRHIDVEQNQVRGRLLRRGQREASATEAAVGPQARCLATLPASRMSSLIITTLRPYERSGQQGRQSVVVVVIRQIL